MSAKSSIEWTEFTWNPVRGCSVVSPGCTRCYAMKIAHRFSGEGGAYQGLTRLSRGGAVWTGQVELVRKALDEPRRWRRPRLVFVNSMSDLFHHDVPLSFIERVFKVISETPHTYQILTKRAERLAEIAAELPWPGNLWMGVSVERDDFVHRVDYLRGVPAATRFISAEPLLGPLRSLDLSGISWVIVGGESGSGARPMDPEWVREIRDLCLEHSVPFHFKQWGGVRKKENGRVLDGQTWDDRPRLWHQQLFEETGS